LINKIDILRNFDSYVEDIVSQAEPDPLELLDCELTPEFVDSFKDKYRYLPQKNLSYKEFITIQDHFKAVDFERSSFLTFSFP
jgi:hypothetical protein